MRCEHHRCSWPQCLKRRLYFSRTTLSWSRFSLTTFCSLIIQTYTLLIVFAIAQERNFATFLAPKPKPFPSITSLGSSLKKNLSQPQNPPPLHQILLCAAPGSRPVLSRSPPWPERPPSAACWSPLPAGLPACSAGHWAARCTWWGLLLSRRCKLSQLEKRERERKNLASRSENRCFR